MGRIFAVAFTCCVVACGKDDGETGENSSGQPNTGDPASSSESGSSNITVGEPTSSSGEPSSSSGSESGSSGVVDTDTGGEACELGDVEVSFTVDIGDFPGEDLVTEGESGLRVTAQCTLEAPATATSVQLSCVDSESAPHTITIVLGGAETVPVLEEGVTYDLHYLTWDTIYGNCLTSAELVHWFTLRGADDALLLGGIDAGQLNRFGEDNMFTPFELTLAEDVCAPVGGGGDTEDSCARVSIGVTIASDGMAGPTLLTGQTGEFLGVEFAVGDAAGIPSEDLIDCCIEGDSETLDVLIVARPPA